MTGEDECLSFGAAEFQIEQHKNNAPTCESRIRERC
jgi:hypothetical protein